MTADASFAWATLLVLGAVHGINPAMGWLFAVSLGMQEGSGRAVWRSLAPMALGHALAIGSTLLVAAAVGIVLPPSRLKWVAAAALLVFGVLHLRGHGHGRWGGMRVTWREMAVWSFLIATAHGAGLMALPSVLRLTGASAAGPVHAHAAHMAHAGLPGADRVALLATLVHTAGYLVLAGGMAWLVYRRLGLRLLRRAWINLDVVWAGALIVTALLTPLL